MPSVPKWRNIPSGFVSIQAASKLSGISRETLIAAIKDMRLAAHCVSCRKVLNRWEYQRGHRCDYPPTWGRGYRVMIPKPALKSFRANPMKVKAARARWAREREILDALVAKKLAAGRSQ